MKITRIPVFQVDLPLEHPYWLSGGRLKFELLDATLVKNGRLHLPERPGPGVHPDEGALGDPVSVYT